MRRFFCAILCLTLLAALALPVSANEVTSLSDRVQKFLFENDLDSQNFSLSYYNCVTEESYSFNPDACFPAGNLWKLPLHMYYYEQESIGAYEPPPEDPFYVFTVDGVDLEECRYRSIILGEEAISIKMREQIGTYDQFKMTVNEAFGHVPKELLPEEFYYENVFSAHFWMNTLQAVSRRPERFRDMMQNYNIVQTADGFAGYDKAYPMVHIRGEEDGFVCDVGEISGPQTYLLVCSVSKAAGGDLILAQINSLVCGYVEETSDIGIASASTVPQQDESAMAIVSGGNDNKASALLWMGIALGGALVLAGILGLVFWLLRRRSKDDYFY